MTVYFITALIYTAFFSCGLFLLTGAEEKIKIEKPQLWLAVILLAGFSVRAWYGLHDYAFWYDINCFKAWANATSYYGLKGMYSSGMFLDYPPGYMYVLALTELIRNVLKLDYSGVIYTFVIKLPAIIADIAGGYFLYRVANDKLKEKWALFIAAAYVFCPALIFNSGIWGQIDSWYTLFMVLALYFVSKDDVMSAAIIYAVALITKPQALLFGPVLLFWVISKRDIKIFFKAVGTGLGCLWLLALPFSQGLSPLWLIDLYKNTFNGYRYFTVNGYNLYMLLDLNWKSLDGVAGAESINMIVIAICFVFCAWSYFRQKGEGKIFSTALVFITVFFSFCTMMHERYMHPALLLALLSFIYTKNKSWLAVYITAAVSNYLNVAASMASQYSGVAVSRAVTVFISLMTIGCTVTAVYNSFAAAKQGVKIELKGFAKEYAAIACLMAIYGAVAFFRLGATTAPQTFYQATQEGEWFVYRFDEKRKVSEIWSYSGMGNQFYPRDDYSVKTGCEFEILAMNENGLWENMANLHHDYVFTWSKLETDFETDAVMVRALADNQVLNELIFLDRQGNLIYGSIESGADFIYQEYSPYNALDESHLLPETEDMHYWGMYFDEIYHGRTAWEQLKGYSIYETTHPPLGKTIISIGIALFGMTPFGWRFMGAVSGILMLLLIWLIVKELSGNSRAAFITAVIFALDFMHYTQTRFSTVDGFLVVFVMLMFLFMIKYAKIPLTENGVQQMLYLLASGVAMGCAVSVKWNGAYCVIGLALYFFFSLWLKYSDFIKAGGRKGTGIVKAIDTCLWCVVCFIIVPVLVYFAAFTPVLYADGIKQTVSLFIEYQKHMFNYHSQLVSDHFFSSPWYSWPVMVKPMWYSISRFGDKAASISAFGNPAVWLAMIPALIYTGVKGIKTKDRAAFVPVAGYLASFLPWIAISRQAFIYHYFPATVFGLLAIGYVINSILEKQPKKEKYIWLYVGLALVLFGVFFPVISGLPVKAAYLDALELLPSWYFN